MEEKMVPGQDVVLAGKWNKILNTTIKKKI